MASDSENVSIEEDVCVAKEEKTTFSSLVCFDLAYTLGTTDDQYYFTDGVSVLNI